MYDVVIIEPKEEDLTPKGFNKHIKISGNQTAESLLKYGFTNHHEPTLYYCRSVGNDISFNLSVDKETLEITNIDILDEDFLQPYDYQAILMKNKEHSIAKGVYYKVNEVLKKLQDDGIIVGFEIGMYI
ncbi:hypothetical protein [Bacillus sp. M6-12]|uniref:hypothetical protein n=1 Tax=Bacillus sp. M6-12 TaxID=2054166 RepID=UPI001158D1B0|nr:hypothetical protein [Bacillus sp. M6-12]